MKRRIFNTLLWTLMAVFLVQFGLIQAAKLSIIDLPIVGAQAQFSVSLVKLVDHDTGVVNAVAAPNGRIFVAYQSRPDGTIYLTEDVGDHLAPLPVPPITATQTLLAPTANDLPGPKQGSVSMLVKDGVLRIYYTGRADDDPTGPFFVWRLTMPIPEAPTL